MSKPVIIIYVDYEEFKPETYNGVVVQLGSDDVEYRFNTGAVVDDEKAALLFASGIVAKTGQEIAYSSTVDHFYMDLRSQEGDE